MTLPIDIVFQIIGYLIALAGGYIMLQKQINSNRTAIAVLAERVDSHSDLFKKIENTLERIERKLDGKADK